MSDLFISGYASRFDEADLSGDIVRRGAFSASLLSRVDPFPMLFGHKTNTPIGVWDRVIEDGQGLFVAGRILDEAEHIYTATHLRPLSVVHVSAKPIGEMTELNWIPRNLDGSDEIDPSAQVEISWHEGAIFASESSTILPVQTGSDTLITLRPIDPMGGFGKSATIQI